VHPQPGRGLGRVAGADGPAQAEAGALGQIGPVLVPGDGIDVLCLVPHPAIGVGGEQVAVGLISAPPAALPGLEPQGAERHLIAVAQLARGDAGQIVLADGVPGRVGSGVPRPRRMVGGQQMFGPGVVVQGYSPPHIARGKSRRSASCGGLGTLNFWRTTSNQRVGGAGYADNRRIVGRTTPTRYRHSGRSAAKTRNPAARESAKLSGARSWNGGSSPRRVFRRRRDAAGFRVSGPLRVPPPGLTMAGGGMYATFL